MENVTLAIASDYAPRLAVGIDIDGQLIERARHNIRHYRTKNAPTEEAFPISLSLCHGQIESGLPSSDVSSKTFPLNVAFVEGSYVLENDDLLTEQLPEYDCILCLSVTKWVHLNWGDDGLKRMFKRIFKQLRPGGRFILEAQQWDSYRKKHSLTVSSFNPVLNS